MISDCYPPRVGGIESQVRDLSRRLVDAGHEVEVFTATNGAEGQRGGVIELVDGIRVHRLGRRVPFGLPLAGGIAHAAYGGIGLALFMGWPFLAGTGGFALAAALVMALVTLRLKHRADTVIGVIWAVGMALGVILLDLTPGYNVDLMRGPAHLGGRAGR